MVGDPLTKNINRVRTFKDDMALSRTQSSVPKDAMVVPPAPAKTSAPVPQQKTNFPRTVTAQAEASSQKEVPAQKNVNAEVFHKKYLTLSDELSEVTKPQKESILSDRDTKSESDLGTSGTIIRDTKRKRFRLLPAMVSATSSWVTGVKEEYENAAHPQSRPVAKAEARAEVIQKAVLQGEQAPREDFKQVSEHLKTVERKPITATLSFKDKSEVPAPSWSYIEDEHTQEETPKTFEELEETVATQVPISNEVVFATESQAEETVTETDGNLEPALAESTQIPLSQPEPILENILPQNAEVENITEEPVVEELPEPIREPVAPVRENLTPTPTFSNEQSSFPIVLFIIVIVGASVLGIGASYYFFGRETTPQEKVLVYKIPSLLRATTQIPVPLPNDRVAFLTAVAQEVVRTQNTTQIYPTVIDETGGQKPAPAEFILEVLEPRASGSFTRSIKEATFGGVTGEPFIVLKTTSFDVGFAGMLAWEETMSADLSPLFGTPVTETFDPSARTDTQVRSAFFKDTIASNKNVRLLLDQDGKDRLVYTFVNQNTIIITTTRTALETLIPLVQ